MANIQVLAKANVLGLPVDAAYQKKADGSSEMIVFGSVSNPTPMSLSDLLTELGTLVTLGSINTDTITNALPDELAKALDSITFSLNLVYFRRQVPAPGANNSTNANSNTATTDTKGSEYAFDISVNLGGITAGFPVEVQSVSFKIWATANTQVLQEMDITRINKLLGNTTV